MHTQISRATLVIVEIGSAKLWTLFRRGPYFDGVLKQSPRRNRVRLPILNGSIIQTFIYRQRDKYKLIIAVRFNSISFDHKLNDGIGENFKNLPPQ